MKYFKYDFSTLVSVSSFLGSRNFLIPVVAGAAFAGIAGMISPVAAGAGIIGALVTSGFAYGALSPAVQFIAREKEGLKKKVIEQKNKMILTFRDIIKKVLDSQKKDADGKNDKDIGITKISSGFLEAVFEKMSDDYKNSRDQSERLYAGTFEAISNDVKPLVQYYNRELEKQSAINKPKKIDEFTTALGSLIAEKHVKQIVETLRSEGSENSVRYYSMKLITA